MGTSYYGVGGIGIEFSEDVIEGFVNNGIFTRESFDEDCDEVFSNVLKMKYEMAGNYYTSDFRHYIFVEGDTLLEINENSQKFIDTFNSFGVFQLTMKDLVVIVDYQIM